MPRLRNQSINLPTLGGTPYAEDSDTEEILIDTWTSLGSTNTGVALLTGIPTATNTYVPAQSNADGTSVRVDRSGLYWAYWAGVDGETSSINVGISVDGAVLTSSFAADDAGMRVFATFAGAGAAEGTDFFVSGLFAIDPETAQDSSLGVVRPMANNADSPGDAYFRIVRFGSFQ